LPEERCALGCGQPKQSWLFKKEMPCVTASRIGPLGSA